MCVQVTHPEDANLRKRSVVGCYPATSYRSQRLGQAAARRGQQWGWWGELAIVQGP